MTAIDKNSLRMGFLEIAGANLTTWNMGGQGQHWGKTALRIVQPIDQVNTARSAAPRADRQTACELCLCASSKRASFFMPNGNPVDLWVYAYCFGNAVYSSFQVSAT